MSFKAEKVWRALRRHPAVHVRTLAVELGYTRMSTCHILLNLEAKGSARRKGKTWKCLWKATAKPPTDGRGHVPASRIALVKNHPHAKKLLENALKAKIDPVLRTPAIPQPAIELERCWGFLPFPGRFDVSAEPCFHKTDAELCPDET